MFVQHTSKIRSSAQSWYYIWKNRIARNSFAVAGGCCVLSTIARRKCVVLQQWGSPPPSTWWRIPIYFNYQLYCFCFFRFCTFYFSYLLDNLTMSLGLDKLTIEDRVVLAQSSGLMAIFEDPISFEIMVWLCVVWLCEVSLTSRIIRVIFL